MSEKIFKELIKSSDTLKYIIYLFKAKYDRIDFNYMEQRDIYKEFK